MLKRPAPSPENAAPLACEHFQCAYVTNDLDQACRILGQRYGLSEFSFINGEMNGGGRIRVAFAWSGGLMYEIIDATGPNSGFYTSRLLESEFSIRFHHLGYLLESPDTLAETKNRLVDSGFKVAFESYTPGFIDAVYVEAPELGHYLEYIFADEQGMAFFDAIPVN